MQAIKIRYPEIEVVGTAGPGIDWIDYREGWKVADKLGFEYLDIHYYAKPGWFIHNQDFYDRMPRNRKTKIYVGEYASHRPDRAGCGESALTEALHLTALERNADIVRMSSYAPLFGKEGFCQWNPNLIYFSNASVCRTPGYYVQKLFSVNCGDRYCFNQLNLDDGNREAHKRIAGSAVMDSETGESVAARMQDASQDRRSRNRPSESAAYPADGLAGSASGCPTGDYASCRAGF